MLDRHSFEQQLQGYRLTTAEILYHMPDHPHLVQSFIWQQLDIAPRYPALHRFLNYWEHNIDGKLHSVKVAQASLVGPSKMGYAQASFSLH
jgi:uncharacterized protein Usg